MTEDVHESCQSLHGRIVASAPIAILAWDCNGTVTEWNAHAQNLFGWTRQEMVGTAVLDTPLIVEEERPALRRMFEDLHRLGLPLSNVNQNTTKTGQRITCDWYNTPIKDAAGRITGWMAIAQDITDRVQAGKKLDERLRFESLLADTSTALIACPSARLGAEIHKALEQLAHLLDIDRLSLGEVSADRQRLHVVESYSRAGPPLEGEIPAKQLFPWSMAQISSGRNVAFLRPEDLPPEAAVDRANFVRLQTRSTAMVPLFRVAGRVDYAVAAGMLTRERDWPETVISQLRLLGDVLVNALARDHAQAVSRISEERLQLALEASRTAVWEWNYQTGQMFWDPHYLIMLGYEPGEIPASYEEWARLSYPDDVAATMRTVRERLDAGHKDYDAEFRMKAKSGEWRWILGRGKVVEFDPSGRPLRLIGTNTDITDRKHAEQMLLNISRGVCAATGQSFFQSLVEHLARSLDAECAMVGELVGNGDRIRSMATYLDGRIVENFEYALNGTPCANVMVQRICCFPSGVQMRFPDDQLLADMKVESYVGTPLMDSTNTPLGILVVLSRRPMPQAGEAESLLQIFASRAAAELERQKTEAAMRQSEQRFRATFEQAAVGMAHLDKDGRWLRVNQKLCEILGYSREEMLAHTAQDMTHPDDRDARRVRDHSLIEGKVSYYSVEKRYIRKNGSNVWAGVTVSLVRDEVGQPQYFIAVIEDISQRKHAEEELRQAKNAAETANRAKDHFLAVLSHELRTPLTPVLAVASMMENDSRIPSDIRQDASTIRRHVETEARLIDDLLDLTRIARGKIRLHFEAVDAHAVLQAVLDMCRADLQAKQLETRLALHAESPLVWADAGRIQQVLLNVVQNAIKFTPDMGHIAIRTSSGEGRFRLTVSDNGIGIDSGRLPHIFNAFEQGEQTVTRQYGGLGLGLAIAKSIVELHKGKIAACSEGRGRGSTFSIELAGVTGSQASTATPEASPRAAEHAPRILLVEDHPDTLRVMSRLLKSMGYAVTTATCVKDALAMAGQEPPFDLLLSDIGLPDGSGNDIMRAFRPRGLRGIALTGFGMEEDVRRSQEAGFVDHLTKPVSLQKLKDALAQALNRRARQGDGVSPPR